MELTTILAYIGMGSSIVLLAIIVVDLLAVIRLRRAQEELRVLIDVQDRIDERQRAVDDKLSGIMS